MTHLLWAAVVGYGLWRFAQVVERVGLAFVAQLADFKPIRESLARPLPELWVLAEEDVADEPRLEIFATIGTGSARAA